MVGRPAMVYGGPPSFCKKKGDPPAARVRAFRAARPVGRAAPPNLYFAKFGFFGRLYDGACNAYTTVLASVPEHSYRTNI